MGNMYDSIQTDKSILKLQGTEEEVLVWHLPETIWRDEERPGIPDISSCSEDQAGPFQPHLMERILTVSKLTK